jgi:hypothetical protein
MEIGSQGEFARSSGRIKISTSRINMNKRSRKIIRPSRAGEERSLAALSSEAATETIFSDIRGYTG